MAEVKFDRSWYEAVTESHKRLHEHISAQEEPNEEPLLVRKWAWKDHFIKGKKWLDWTCPSCDSMYGHQVEYELLLDDPGWMPRCKRCGFQCNAPLPIKADVGSRPLMVMDTPTDGPGWAESFIKNPQRGADGRMPIKVVTSDILGTDEVYLYADPGAEYESFKPPQFRASEDDTGLILDSFMKGLPKEMGENPLMAYAKKRTPKREKPDLMAKYEEAKAFWDERQDAVRDAVALLQIYVKLFGIDRPLADAPVILEQMHREAVEQQQMREMGPIVRGVADASAASRKSCHGTLSCEMGQECPAFQTCRRAACDKLSG